VEVTPDRAECFYLPVPLLCLDPLELSPQRALAAPYSQSLSSAGKPKFERRFYDPPELLWNRPSREGVGTRELSGLTMTNLINLPPFTEDGDIYVVVETPRGSRAKFDYDPKLKTFSLSKSLLTGLTYPHDWGFVPSTKADDGDPIDIMVVHDAATFPGIVLTCRVIGILQIEQTSKGKTERNDRLFAVPKVSHSEQALKDVNDLSKPIRQELEKFFVATDELEDKKLDIIGWKGPKAAVQAIKDASKSFKKNGK
jgi:inorganic pyrophosphatase